MLGVRRKTEGGVMKNSFGYARVALLCASAMLMSNLHAAPRCTADVRVLVLTQAQTQRAATVITQTCRSGCERAEAEAGAPAAPPHLPVLTELEDVADWHAQIYERLSESRDTDDLLQYCQADPHLM